MGITQPYNLLCLGDSYTIGEGVLPDERFPSQAVELLKQQSIVFQEPVIIAQTGWTTDELSTAVEEKNPQLPFDFATLLIGVNNQYRARSIDNYRSEFRALLLQAVQFAGGNPAHVAVLSIPDWGVTPFVMQDAKKRTPQQIAAEIDAFNSVNLEEAENMKVHYINVTTVSRKAATDESLIASDGLHPSAAMYAQWAVLLAELIAQQIPKNKS